jgi:hypothetical protein
MSNDKKVLSQKAIDDMLNRLAQGADNENKPLSQQEMNELMRRTYNPTQSEMTDDIIIQVGRLNSMRELNRVQFALDKTKFSMINKNR